jgi:hypothetical protein
MMLLFFIGYRIYNFINRKNYYKIMGKLIMISEKAWSVMTMLKANSLEPLSYRQIIDKLFENNEIVNKLFENSGNIQR